MVYYTSLPCKLLTGRGHGQLELKPYTNTSQKTDTTKRKGQMFGGTVKTSMVTTCNLSNTDFIPTFSSGDIAMRSAILKL